MDRWITLVPGGFVVLLLAGLGCAVKYGKAYWLIKSYNAMSEEKKKSVDIAALARFTGNSLFAIAGVIAVTFVLFALNLVTWGLAALALLLPGIIYMVIQSQKLSGVEKKTGGMATQTKITIALLVVVLGGAAVGVTALIRSSMQPAQFSVSGDTLQIKCAFGETVQMKDMKGLELQQKEPDITSRTFGSALGNQLRGSFDLADGTAARVFMENAKPPFIHFMTGSTQYFINCVSPEETNRLFGQLKDHLEQ